MITKEMVEYWLEENYHKWIDKFMSQKGSDW